MRLGLLLALRNTGNTIKKTGSLIGSVSISRGMVTAKIVDTPVTLQMQLIGKIVPIRVNSANVQHKTIISSIIKQIPIKKTSVGYSVATLSSFSGKLTFELLQPVCISTSVSLASNHVVGITKAVNVTLQIEDAISMEIICQTQQ